MSISYFFGSAGTFLRLTFYFKLFEGFFLRLQMSYDLRAQSRALGNELDLALQQWLPAPCARCNGC
jgi:hypothetical protein